MLKRDCFYAARFLGALALLLATLQSANGQAAAAESGRSQFGISLICFSNDGRTLAIVRGSLNKQRFDHFDGYQRYSGYFGYNGEIEIWDLSSGKRAQHLKEFKGPVLSATFSPDGERLATGSWEGVEDKPIAKPSELKRTFGVVKVWDLRTGGLVWSQKAYNTDVSGVAYAPDGRTLASSGTRRSPNFSVGEVKVWDALTGGLIRTLEYRTPVSGIAFSPDGRTLAVRKNILNESKGEVKLSNVKTWKEERTLKGDRGITLVEAMRSVAFSPDGKTLALAINGLDGDELFSEIQLWDMAQGKLKRSLVVDKKPIKGLDRVSKSFWRFASRLLPPNRPTASLTFSADGRTVFSINEQVQMKAWDVESGAVKILVRSDGEVASVAMSPDAKVIATGEFDNNVRLWETTTGKVKHTIAGSADWTGTFSAESLVVSVNSILSVAFFPDGKTLAGATSNKAVKVWERLGYRVVDLLVQHFAGMRDGPVGAKGEPHELLAAWSGRRVKTPPIRMSCWRGWKKRSFPNNLHVDHPRFFAFVPGPGNFVSTMADALASGFNVFNGTWLGGSAAAALELTVIDWFRAFAVSRKRPAASLSAAVRWRT